MNKCCSLCLQYYFLTQLKPGEGYTYHPPTQSPINPPYQKACYLKKHDLLAKQQSTSSLSSEGDSLSVSSNNKMDRTEGDESEGASAMRGDGHGVLKDGGSGEEQGAYAIPGLSD